MVKVFLFIFLIKLHFDPYDGAKRNILREQLLQLGES